MHFEELISEIHHLTYPTEVLERLKVLIEHMLAARREGNRAVLVLEKLYVNNRLFQLPTTNN